MSTTAPNFCQPTSVRLGDLPVALFLRILSYFRSFELIRLQFVSEKWKKTIRNIIWSRKTTITKRDVDPNAPRGIQLIYFTQLAAVLRPVNYFYFPRYRQLFFDDIERDNEFNQRVVRALCEAEHVLRKRLQSGDIALHTDALVFVQRLRKMRNDVEKTKVTDKSYLGLKTYEYPSDHSGARALLADCNLHLAQTVIIPRWKVDYLCEYSDGATMLLGVHHRLEAVRRMVFDHLESELDYDYCSPELPIALTSLDDMSVFLLIAKFNVPMEFRVRKVSLYCHSHGVRIVIRLKWSVIFSIDAIRRVFRALIRFTSDTSGMSDWKELITKWHSVGMIESLAVKLSRHRISTFMLNESLKHDEFRPFEYFTPTLLSALFQLSIVTSLAIAEWPDKAVQLIAHLHRVGILANLTKLVVHAPIEHEPQFDDLFQLCDNIVLLPEQLLLRPTAGAGLKRIRHLSLDADIIRRYSLPTCSSAPWQIRMPDLEYLNVAGTLDCECLTSILNDAPFLRHLSLQLSVSHVPLDERSQLTRSLQEAIGQESLLTSLTLEMGGREPKTAPYVHSQSAPVNRPSYRAWLGTWLQSGDPSSDEVVGVQPETLYLRSEAMATLKQLALLHWLDLRFQPTKASRRDDTHLLEKDKKEIHASHHFLQFLHLDDHVRLKKGMQNFKQDFIQIGSQFD